MKRALLLCVCFLCLLVAVCSNSVKATAKTYDRIEFLHNGKIFEYDLAQNLKTSQQFDLNYELNKYNRFGSNNQRKQLLKHLLDIGLDENIALDYLFPNLSKTIDRMEKNIKVEPKDATLTINSNSKKVFNITNERVGCKLNKPELYKQIIYKFLTDKNLTISLPTTELQPSVFASSLKKFSNLRADFSTNISSSSADRKHNIKNALNSLNKVEIYPNEIFSFNKTVGRRSEANGYREAKIIVNNEFVDGLGGGVCQVSSTLYNSALLAGLKIVEANKHSKQVNYVKYGFDAMVNFGSSDLKFKNNTNQKITIITNFSPTTARIRIFGEELKESYKLTNEIISVTEPEEEIVIDSQNKYANQVQFEDEFFYLKRASKGMEIKSYREKYLNGKLVKKELLRFDKYPVQNAIKVYGAKKRESQGSPLNLIAC